MEELREEVDRELQGQDMVPTDTIPDVDGHGCLQLLKHLPCLRLCTHAEHITCAYVTCVYVSVFVRPKADAEIKETGE